MKHIFKISMIALIILLLCGICITVFAHPGDTDSGGGHYDHSTGNYHYHHGYAAHDHYDMDGDGDIDCPYNFKDKTGSNSGSQSTGNNISKTDPNSNTLSNSTTTSTKIERVATVPAWVYWVFAGSAIVIILLYFSSKNKTEEIARLTTQHQHEIKSMEASCEKEIAERLSAVAELNELCEQIKSSKKEHVAICALIEKESKDLENIKQLRTRLKNAPLDVTFTNDGMPIFYKPTSSRPYGDYTVYISKTSKIYHIDQLCAPHSARKAHIFSVIRYARPCKKCAEGFFDFSAVPDWFDNKQ